MTALEDRRPVAATTTISRHPNVIGEDLAQLLLEHPDLELASIRLIPSTEHEGVGIAGRIGQIVEQTAEYPCCHQLIGRPHTEYCAVTLAQRYDADPRYRRADGYTHAQALEHCTCVTSGPDAYGPDDDCPMHGVNPTIRPDDDPADEITCNGRNCGGYPHA